MKIDIEDLIKIFAILQLRFPNISHRILREFILTYLTFKKECDIDTDILIDYIQTNIDFGTF